MRSLVNARLWQMWIAVAALTQLVACGGSDVSEISANPPPLPGQTLAPTRRMDYSGVPSIFDRRRERFYAVSAGQIISIDPATGSHTILVAEAADAPRASGDVGNQLALSASGVYLYIAASSNVLARFNLVSGQIDQRLALPPGPVGGTRLINSVLASNTVDQHVYVQYTELSQPVVTASTTIEIWLTKVEGATWSEQRLLLGTSGTLRMKPDDTEILLKRDGLRRIRIGSDGKLAFEGVEGALPKVGYYPSIAPAYVETGILFQNAVYDATTLEKLHDIPAVSCSALADPNHAICIGSAEPSHSLFVYDLGRRQVLFSWAAGLPPSASGLGPAVPTGWISVAGPNRVLVYYSWNVYKGFNDFGLYLYEDPSLN